MHSDYIRPAFLRVFPNMDPGDSFFVKRSAAHPQSFICSYVFFLKRLLSGKHRAFLAPTFGQPGKVIADANADPGALR